jgi:predicted P-loop ATPase
MPIELIHDGPLDLATGRNRHESNWKNKVSSWGALLKKLATTQRTTESYAEYLNTKKPRQDEIKDVGGFVGGYLAGGKRGKGTVNYRQLVTLDVDFAPPGIWDDLMLMWGCAAAVYSTHKHSPDKPRLRLLIPLDRQVLCDEYCAISRRIAGTLGIEYFDDTTYQPERLMYWPSTSKDGEYLFEYQDGEWLSADEMLSSYRDWKDSSEWPVSDREGTVLMRAMKKAGDPLDKQGVVGAFCRTFTIHDAISTYLSDVYTPCDIEGRYSYVDGTTSAGLITYDDKYAYSHHGTDPVSMRLCNAFDIVRIHLFGLKDENVRADTPVNRTPSHLAMEDLARKDARVRKLIVSEKIQSAHDDFAGIEDEDTGSLDDKEPVNDDWQGDLDCDRKGTIYSTIANMVLILENDPRLKGKFALNEFDQREVLKGTVPWRKFNPSKTHVTDKDVSHLRHYFEKSYGISSAPKLEDAFRVILDKNQYHPVKDYLSAQVWDGEKRIDTLLTDYLGVTDSPYTRAIIRKTLAAAVTRIFNPGCKFDYVLTLIGDQGLKKSTLIDKLGVDWFSDSFTTVQGKEAYEQLQGAWILEIAELSGMRRADVETVKHFITKRKDRYRVSYGRRIEEFLRQCIFVATTNDKRPLRDATGGRRFWPAEVHAVPPAMDVTDLTPDVVGQIWAEAVLLYKSREPLYLSPELEAIAAQVQADHTDIDERVGMIQAYLDKLLPEDWDERDVFARRAWLHGDELQAGGTVKRNRVCAVELCVECLGWRKQDVDRSSTREIHDMMRFIPGWKASKSKLQFGEYGTLKGYVREDAPMTRYTPVSDFDTIMN